MKQPRCSLCRNPPDFSYDVEADKPKPLCNACFAAHEPRELDRKLGVVQFHPEIPKPEPVQAVTYIRKRL